VRWLLLSGFYFGFLLALHDGIQLEKIRVRAHIAKDEDEEK